MKGEAGGGVTNEGRQSGSRTQQQARMEIMKEEKMKGDKAAATSRPFGDCSNPVFEK